MKKIEHNAFKLCVPEGVPALLAQFCQHSSICKDSGRDFYKYAYIVYTVATKSTYYKTDKDYCTINIKNLTQILGTKDSETSKMIKNLVALRIIKKVGGYVPGVKSYSYALVTPTVVWDNIIPTPKYAPFLSKIIYKRNSQRTNLSNDLKTYKKYVSQITVDIPVDYFSTCSNQDLCNANSSKEKVSSSSDPLFSIQSCSSALPSYTQSSYSNLSFTSLSTASLSGTLMIGDYSSNSMSINVTEDLIALVCTVKKVNPQVVALQAIEEGNWFVHRPDKKSRVHTNLTNLKTEFRDFLRYDGKPFIEMDIRNSQPLIATILIKKYWLERGKGIPADVLQYQKDCEIGIFYDWFMESNGIHRDHIGARTEFKEKFFGEVFFSKVSKRTPKLRKQFKLKYPSAHEAICHIKGGLGSKTYNRFAISLQRTEASIIFDNVNMGLLKDEIPAFNIFDSILCLAEHKEIAKKRIMDAFAVYEVTPTINYKEYNS